jgi:hypothetical protein
VTTGWIVAGILGGILLGVLAAVVTFLKGIFRWWGR